MSKQQIYIYKLYLFNSKENYIELSQEEGQRLIMMISSDSKRKFVMIGDAMINISAIERLFNCSSIINNEPEFRELTPSEEKTQKLYLEFKNKEQKLLC